MKLHIDLEMTPDEARRVMGLPDIAAMQDRIVAEVEKQMTEAIKSSADPEAMLKTWFTWGNQGMEQFQRFVRDTARTTTRDRGSR
ncbi:MAG TPA: DUF6489 family protein [Rhizomicrobium sp.]|jgi:hypothetical protein